MGFLKHADSLYIGGEFVRAADSEAVINPADESLIMMAPVGTSQMVGDAIGCAREAFDKGEWPRISQGARIAKLTEFLDAIERRKAEFIALIIAEAGSTQMLADYLQYGIPMKHARHMVDISARAAAKSLPVEISPNAAGGLTLGMNVMIHEPLGVISAITPYNFPFFLNIGKIIPAMAVGCTVVLKPSPYTPIEALILGEIADEVGLPKGVLNIVTGGIEASTLMTTDNRVDLVHFTGSDKVGVMIQAQAAPNLTRCVMELGGKSALIVRADANLMEAAQAAIGGFITHCGQGCALTTRMLIHHSIKEQFVQMIVGMLGHVKVGNPVDPTVSCGPLIREVARKRTEDYVQIAQDQGAKLVAGGKRPAGLDKGFYYEPTLFTDVDNKSRLAQEEVFGPIGAVIGFESDEEAIAIANDSDFGLAGGIYSANVGLAYEMALQLRTGGVGINGGGGGMSSNAPFGGIKRSGYGREYGVDGLNEFTYIKSIGFHGG